MIKTESTSMNTSPLASAPLQFKSMPLKLRPIFGILVTSAQIIADFFTVAACFIGSHWFYTDSLNRPSPQTFQEFAYFSIAAGVLYVLVLDRVGLYRREISLLNIKELRGVFRSAFYAAAFILSASFYIRSTTLSRITLTAALVSTPILLYLQRQVFYKVHLLFHQKGWSRRKVMIYGAGLIGTHLARRLFESPSLGLLPVGFLDDDATKQGGSLRLQQVNPRVKLPIFSGIDFWAQCKAVGAETVVIALPSASFQRNQELVEQCVANGLEYLLVPNAYEKFIQNVQLFEIGGIPILRRKERRISPYYRLAKRMVDFSVSATLILLFSPLYFVLSALIKWDSPGPIIFKQKRVGLRGKEFSFYKFRSMYVEAPKYGLTPQTVRDPRITRMGRWLRRSSLDELPQLFNVLRGDMSLVGPRPEMPFIVETYSPLHRRRLDAKPGITGVWQISAVRGEPIHANIEYDLFYIENQSLLLDVAILIKTGISVLRGIGAV